MQNSNQKNINSSEKSSSLKGLLVLFMLVSIGMSMASSYYFSKETSKTVINDYLSIEYKKSGGKENYDLFTEAQRLQFEQQLPQIKQFIQNGGNTSPTNPTTDASAQTTSVTKKLSKDDIAAIKKIAYIEGNKDAKITLVEYSDLECPYCIRQHKEGTIQSVFEKYKEKVNFIYKTFRGVPHENSEIEANALLCVGDQGGAEKYTAYYSKILSTSTGNGTGFSKDSLIPLAKELGLDGSKVQSCIDSKKNIARYDAETQEGIKLGVQGTPGTVVINNETGEYELIAGAYPISEFIRIIDKLLK